MKKVLFILFMAISLLSTEASAQKRAAIVPSVTEVYKVCISSTPAKAAAALFAKYGFKQDCLPQFAYKPGDERYDAEKNFTGGWSQIGLSFYKGSSRLESLYFTYAGNNNVFEKWKSELENLGYALTNCSTSQGPSSYTSTDWEFWAQGKPEVTISLVNGGYTIYFD